MTKFNSRPHLTPQIKIKLAKMICSLYGEGQHTIASCCEAFNVDYNTFQSWAQPNLIVEDIENKTYRRGFVKDVHELYKETLLTKDVNYKALLKNAVREGVLKRVRGISYNEVHSVAKIDADGNPTSASIKKTERYIPPDTGVLIFLAKYLGLLITKFEASDIDTEHLYPFRHLSNEQLLTLRKQLDCEIV